MALSAPDASTVAATVIALVALALSIGQLIWARRGRKRDRLAAFKREYASTVKPALVTLGRFKQQLPDGRLWTALMPPAAQPAAPLAAPPALQLPEPLLREEAAARNVAKDFWEAFTNALEDGDLPASFGRAVRQPDDRGLVRFTTGHDGGTWRERADNFRCLVEPFDIANYYRSGFDVGSGHYLADDNRPAIFARLEAMTISHLKAQLLGGRVPPQAAQQMYTCSTVWAHAKAGSVPRSSGWAPLSGGPERHAPTQDAQLP